VLVMKDQEVRVGNTYLDSHTLVLVGDLDLIIISNCSMNSTQT
jgi:hypothetical protein